MVRALVTLCLAICACGGAPAAAPSPTVALPRAGATATPLPSGALRFAAQSKSHVTVKVEEHLAVNTINTDAVLTTDGVTGTLTLLPDATFTPDSQITVDMTKLRSDQDLRDTWIRLFGIETNRFRVATFTAKRAVGLPSPLPDSGSWPFTIEGDLTIHGVTKPTTWQATAQRTGADLTANATLTIKWADFGVGKPQAAVTQVVSVSDDIRLEIALVAKQT
jgi:polyisoprenoid-binding protein YceI